MIILMDHCLFAAPHMAVRLLKVSSVATAVFASSGFYLYSKNVDFRDLSIIRFGRAAATVNMIFMIIFFI